MLELPEVSQKVATTSQNSSRHAHDRSRTSPSVQTLYQTDIVPFQQYLSQLSSWVFGIGIGFRGLLDLHRVVDDLERVPSSAQSPEPSVLRCEIPCSKRWHTRFMNSSNPRILPSMRMPSCSYSQTSTGACCWSSLKMKLMGGRRTLRPDMMNEWARLDDTSESSHLLDVFELVERLCNGSQARRERQNGCRPVL